MKTARLSGADFREVGSAVNTLLPAAGAAGLAQMLASLPTPRRQRIQALLPVHDLPTLEHRVPLAKSPRLPAITSAAEDEGDALSCTARLDGYTRHAFAAMCAHYGCSPAEWLAGHFRDEIIAWLELSDADPLLPAIVAAENPLAPVGEEGGAR